MITIEDNSKLYFTSDTHFFHKNIIEYAKRPFSNIESMHEHIRLRWNNVITSDHVFILGDFAFMGNIAKIKELLNSLNGKKYLILGNHDYQNHLDRDSVKELFSGVYDILELKVMDDEMDDGYQRITLCHYPIEYWNNKSKGQWHLHGHIHSHSDQQDSHRLIKNIPNRYDVGVDNNSFAPISYQEVKIKLTQIALGL